MRQLYRNQLDLLFSLFVTAAAAALLILLPEATGAWRTVPVLLVALLIPGYLFTLVMFPKQQHVDPDQRLVLSLGFSIFFVVLLGLALNYTPWGIRTEPTILALLALVVLLSLLAVLRRLAASPDSLFRLQVPGRVLLIGLALLIAAVFVADVLVPTKRYSEFYTLGANGRLEGYPRTLSPNETFALTLGVINRDGRNQSYKVESLFTFQDRTSGSPQTVVAKALTPILDVPVLPKREPWESEVFLTAPGDPGEYTLELHLYRAQDKTPYRSLSLLLSVLPSSASGAASTVLEEARP